MQFVLITARLITGIDQVPFLHRLLDKMLLLILTFTRQKLP